MSSKKDNPTNEKHMDPRLNKRLKDTPIAIVGMASLFAHSRYLDQFWDLISDQIDGITDVPSSHWQAEDYFDTNKSAPDKTYCKRGGFLPEVDFNPMEFGLPPNLLELTDTSQLLSLLVAKDVLADAGITNTSDKSHIGITLGVGGGQKISHSLATRLQYPVLKKVFKESGINDKDSEMLIKKFQDQFVHWEENSFPGSLGNVIAGRIANRFDLGGMNCVVDAACAGSLAAMRMAISELVDGRSDMMITGGVCTDNSPYMYMSFSKTPAFTTQEVIQPFDINSKGMMIGEGIGMVALKRLKDAERDNDKIYAVIKGVGSSSDGKFKSIYAPRPEGQAKALKRAYDDAGFAPHTLGLIEAHGTGTAAGDVAEFNGLKSVFSEACDKKQHIALGSVKSQIGHTKSTAGTAGLIKAALALHHKVLPPTINVSQPNPKLNIEDSPFYLNTQTRPWLPRADGAPRRAGISSFGFGGTNFHFVLEEYQQEHKRPERDEKSNLVNGYRQRRVPQTFLFSQPTRDSLIEQLTQILADAKKNHHAIHSMAETYSFRKLKSTHPRIGFVANNHQDLIEKLILAIGELNQNKMTHWTLPQGISFRAKALVDNHKDDTQASAKVAALFAGQGSQYTNMGLELGCHFPEVRQQFTLADNVFGQHNLDPVSQQVFPRPVFNKQDEKAQTVNLTQTLYAQSAIGALSMGQYDLLTHAGFNADIVAGHSFGELSALCAAGVIKRDDYYQLAFARGQAMSQIPQGMDAGSMAAVIAQQAGCLPQIQGCLKDIQGVDIANFNSPTQFVIAGEKQALESATQALKSLGFKVITLPVSGAFHTPLVAHAQAPFAKAIDKVSFTKPQRLLFSNSTAKAYTNNANSIKASFKQHMLQAVNFSQQVEAMYHAGARVFVEFGPKSTLQKLVLETLADKKDECCVVSVNPKASFHHHQNSDQQLRQAAIEMAVAGITLETLDPYQAPTRQPEKVTPMTIKLSATNYISQGTQNKMAQSLSSGKISPEIQIQDRIIEKEKVVEVKKIIEVDKKVDVNQEANQAEIKAVGQGVNPSVHSPVTQTTHTTTQQAKINPQLKSQSAVPNDNSALSQFFAAQQQTAQLHQTFLTIPQQYNETVTHMMAEQAKMANAGVDIPAALEQSMAQFHQHQADTLKNHAQYLNLQSQSNQAVLNLIKQDQTLPHQSPSTLNESNLNESNLNESNLNENALNQNDSSTPVPINEPIVQQDIVQTSAQEYSIKAYDNPSTPTIASTQEPLKQALFEAIPAHQALSTNKLNITDIQTCMLSVVSDKTGYPVEMLNLEMDMEADLGIDSIKRVEILASVQDKLPELPELNPDDLSECRTLGEIVTYLNSQSTSTSTSTSASIQATSQSIKIVEQTADIQTCMLSVVSDKTGYPAEMLNLEMDMEADLGIDSIKRVEILASVQDKLPELPELNPDDLSECRTLGEIVTYLNSQSPNTNTSTSTSIQATRQSSDIADIQICMLSVVSDKTGYPVEMLNLEMDMEADLGIDSIKRVEILASVQDKLPELPELNPDDLSECRTLGEIVTYLSLQNNGSQSDSSQNLNNQSFNNPSINSQIDSTNASVSGTSMQEPHQSIEMADIQTCMLSVVSDKTGYPAEMLNLEMDMEADLGIDSIKRMEILASVQDKLPELPELNPDDLSECRTLGEIVTYLSLQNNGSQSDSSQSLNSQNDSTSASVSGTSMQKSHQSIEMADIQTCMLSVMSDKTGYPAEMLNLEMDMEADLGIDSIKRVEILASVQDKLPELPELNPDDLSECRTLGEIVTYLNSQSPNTNTSTST
ncbi:type I polyketide synthase, partial [uncultured Shewanella sp.]|uniref:type I polyketide synthase n=1 Tax=uncultured Shewanella sp. TaxID=173975 RepID=UPI002624D1EB